MNAKEILELAKQTIHDRGWCQGDYENTDRNVCMLGAINTAVTGSAWNRFVDDAELRKERVEARIALERVTGRLIPEFNDAPDTTIEKVYEAFDAAIARV